MEDKVILILEQLLSKSGYHEKLNLNSRLLGSIPEIDSLFVATLLGTLESEFKIHIEDDEVDGSLFETVESLARFLQKKISIGTS